MPGHSKGVAEPTYMALWHVRRTEFPIDSPLTQTAWHTMQAVGKWAASSDQETSGGEPGHQLAECRSSLHIGSMDHDQICKKSVPGQRIRASNLQVFH